MDFPLLCLITRRHMSLSKQKYPREVCFEIQQFLLVRFRAVQGCSTCIHIIHIIHIQMMWFAFPMYSLIENSAAKSRKKLLRRWTVTTRCRSKTLWRTSTTCAQTSKALQKRPFWNQRGPPLILEVRDVTSQASISTYVCMPVYIYMIWYVCSYVCVMVLIEKGGSKKYVKIWFLIMFPLQMVKKWRPIPECKTSRSIDRSIYIYIDRSIYLSIYRSIDLSIDRSIYLSIYLSDINLHQKSAMPAILCVKLS